MDIWQEGKPTEICQRDQLPASRNSTALIFLSGLIIWPKASPCSSRQFSLLYRLYNHSWNFSGLNSPPLYFNTLFSICHLIQCVYVTILFSRCQFMPSFLLPHKKSLGPQRVSECDTPPPPRKLALPLVAPLLILH